jgi:hypothetical protein
MALIFLNYSAAASTAAESTATAIVSTATESTATTVVSAATVSSAASDFYKIQQLKQQQQLNLKYFFILI